MRGKPQVVTTRHHKHIGWMNDAQAWYYPQHRAAPTSLRRGAGMCNMLCQSVRSIGLNWIEWKSWSREGKWNESIRYDSYVLACFISFIIRFICQSCIDCEESATVQDSILYAILPCLRDRFGNSGVYYWMIGSLMSDVDACHQPVWKNINHGGCQM